ncbi:MAG: site-2 protease family protein [Anaerolineales bacterium]|nr:site-2 protease family protein [Anaerolineales bacterium]
MIINILQFIGVLASLIILHEVGHFLACLIFGVKVEEFGIGFPPRITKLFEFRGTEYTLNWIPLGGFVKPLGESQPEIEGGLASSKPLVRIGVYLAGPIMNLLAAVVIYSVVFSQLGVPDMSVIEVQEVAQNSPAQEAGLLPGDHILSINEIESDSYEALRGEIYANLGEEIQIEYQRDGNIDLISLVPRENPPENQGAIGIVMTSPVREISWYQALPLGISATGQHSIAVMKLPGQLIRGTEEAAGRPVGYKGMYDIYEGAKEGQLLPGTSSTINVLLFVVSITISLGVLNLLPIPALDGGRILFVLPELIVGKRVSQNVQNVVNAAGFIIVVLLLIYFNILDFTSPVQLP